MAAIDRTNYKRIQRSYYNINIYNDTNDDIEAKYSANTIVPLLDKPNQYEVSVVRASVPLDGIPISQYNIGFESWQVQFTNTQTNDTSNAYVQQFLPNIIPLYNFNTTILGINGDALVNMTINSIQSPTGNVSMVIGSLPFGQTLLIQGFTYGGSNPSGFTNISNVCYSQDYVVSCSQTEISRYTYEGVFVDSTNASTSTSVIRGICASQIRNNIYYLAYDPDRNSSNWYLCNLFGGDTVDIFQTSALDYPANTNIYSMSCTDTQISLSIEEVGTEDSEVYTMSYVFNISGATTGFPRVNPDQVLIRGTLVFFLDSKNRYYVSFNNIHVILFNQTDIPTSSAYLKEFNIPDRVSNTFVRFLGSDTWDNLLVLLLNIPQTSYNTYSIAAYNKTTGGDPVYTIQIYGIEPISMSNFITTPGPTTIGPSLTPNYQIWNYQTYLDQINIAIATAFNGIKGSDGWPTQETPYLSYSDSKFSLNCGVGLAQPICKMSFNTRLWQRFIFNSSTNTTDSNYEDLQILNLIPNIVDGVNLMCTQPHNTNYRWFDITRIIVRSTKMSVAGDVELSNTSLLNITDFAVDTSEPDVLLQIYEPTVLRFYQLYQTSPLNAIDVQLSYATRSGDIFPIFITAGSDASVKLLFRRSNFQLAL